jgi:hypothetical protein
MSLTTTKIDNAKSKEKFAGMEIFVLFVVFVLY